MNVVVVKMLKLMVAVSRISCTISEDLVFLGVISHEQVNNYLLKFCGMVQNC